MSHLWNLLLGPPCSVEACKVHDMRVGTSKNWANEQLSCELRHRQTFLNVFEHQMTCKNIKNCTSTKDLKPNDLGVSGSTKARATVQNQTSDVCMSCLGRMAMLGVDSKIWQLSCLSYEHQYEHCSRDPWTYTVQHLFEPCFIWLREYCISFQSNLYIIELQTEVSGTSTRVTAPLFLWLIFCSLSQLLIHSVTNWKLTVAAFSNGNTRSFTLNGRSKEAVSRRHI